MSQAYSGQDLGVVSLPSPRSFDILYLPCPTNKMSFSCVLTRDEHELICAIEIRKYQMFPPLTHPGWLLHSQVGMRYPGPPSQVTPQSRQELGLPLPAYAGRWPFGEGGGVGILPVQPMSAKVCCGPHKGGRLGTPELKQWHIPSCHSCKYGQFCNLFLAAELKLIHWDTCLVCTYTVKAQLLDTVWEDAKCKWILMKFNFHYFYTIPNIT